MKSDQYEKMKRIVARLNRRYPLSPHITEADDRLDEINKQIGGFGVEGFEDREGNRILYINMGDPYDTTIYYDEYDGKFHVGSWGDLIEENSKRFEASDEESD